jgi:hypothetical protein
MANTEYNIHRPRKIARPATGCILKGYAIEFKGGDFPALPGATVHALP